MLVPVTYNLRSLWVRWSATLLTVCGVGATVAVLSGVLALQQGFETLFSDAGREDLFIFLRPGANNETDSILRREKADRLIKTLPEIRPDENGRPLASMECYLAVRRHKLVGGQTNVPVRGVEPMSFRLYGDDVRIVEGRRFRPGADEVIVGRRLGDRIRNCRLGDVIQLNTTPLKVVGVFESNGPFASEIWGDLDRMQEALERPSPNRVVALLRDGVDPDALAKRLADDKETPAKMLNERDYLAAQTSALSTVLLGLGAFLAVVMGIAAIFTATNTMLASVGARTHEIGILLASGFRPVPIFLSFLLEAATLGLLGGAVGCLFVMPLNGVQTGATNFDTFTEIAFAFRVNAWVLTRAVTFALVLGLVGGAIPAWRAARLSPIDALRRR